MASGSSSSISTPPVQQQPRVPESDRTSHAEATVLGFIAEQSMSLSMAPRLVSLAKHLARDPVALDKMSMERSAASYKLRFGMGKTFHEQIREDIGESFFSLNLDEVMNSNHEKILSVLVSYYSESRSRVLI